MTNPKIIYASLTNIIYARAFFLTSPSEHPLMAGETRSYPIKYSRGGPAATAFRLDWYADQSDADALRDKLTDTARLPTAQFIPTTPDTDAPADDTLQDGSVLLTAPAATANGYVDPVAKLEMVQETGTIAPYLYLLSDEITMPTVLTEHRFKYYVGDPAATAFHLEWYPTRLQANLMTNRLTDTDRLPTATFLPPVPNAAGEPETFQDGVLQLRPPVSDMPYTSAVGVLCMVQDPILEGDPDAQALNIAELRPTQRVISNWRPR